MQSIAVQVQSIAVQVQSIAVQVQSIAVQVQSAAGRKNWRIVMYRRRNLPSLNERFFFWDRMKKRSWKYCSRL